MLATARHAGTWARPAPSAPGVPGSDRRGRGAGRAAGRPLLGRAGRAPSPGPGLLRCRRPPGRRATTCLAHAAGSPHAPPARPCPGQGGGRGRGGRHPLRRESPNGEPCRAAGAETATLGARPEWGRFRRLLACSLASSSWGGGFMQLLLLLPGHETSVFWLKRPGAEHPPLPRRSSPRRRFPTPVTFVWTQKGGGGFTPRTPALGEGAGGSQLRALTVGWMTACGSVGGCFLQDFLTLYWEFSLHLTSS